MSSSSASSATIKNCTNFADLLVMSGNKGTSPYIGGIIGTGQATGSISNCTNSGNITASSLNKGGYVGGIAGQGCRSISNCTNSGKIYAQGMSTSYVLYIGGIVSYTTYSQINNACNTGDISCEGKQYGAYIGGIVGQTSTNIGYSYNSGTITNRATDSSSYSYIAGIAGSASSTISNCYNTGDVTEASSRGSAEYVGGIAGTALKIIDVYNTGDVTDTASTASTEYVGGIVGQLKSSGTLSGAIMRTYNIGNVNNGGYTNGSSSNNLYTGGIYGYGSKGSGNENHYLDDIDVIGPNTGTNSGNLPMCEECTEEYMRADGFCEELKNGSSYSNWIQEENQYPTLDIKSVGNSNGVTEITIGNTKKTFDITAQIVTNSSDGKNTGTITTDPTNSSPKYIYTSDDKKYIEEVKYGENNAVAVNIEPSEGYMIQKITANNKEIPFTIDESENYKIPANYFTNINEDINIKVYFVNKNNSLIINKTDDNGNRLAGAIFKVESDKLDIDDVLGEPEANGKYYFEKDDAGDLIPNNKGINGATANSYYEIDLRSTTGDSIVEVEAALMGPGCLYGMITESPDVPEYNENDDFIYETSSFGPNKKFITNPLAGGKLYYLHLGYMCNAPASSITVSIKDITILAIGEELDADLQNAEETDEPSYHFEKGDNGYVPNNLQGQNTNAVSYIPIDLKEKSGNYSVKIDVNTTNAGNLCGFITKDKVMPGSSTQPFFQASNTGEASFCSPIIKGGDLSYLCLVFIPTGTEDTNPVVVESIKIATEETYLTGATNENGQAILDVPEGNYKITEIKAPEGYSLNETPQECEVSSEEDSKNEVTIQNEKLKEVIIHYYLKGKVQEQEELTNTLSKNSVTEKEKHSVAEKIKESIKQPLQQIANEQASDKNNQLISLKEDMHLYGKNGDDYNVEKYIELELQGYTLEVDDSNQYVIPSNATGKFGDNNQDVIHVNLYYEKHANKQTDIKVTKQWDIPKEESDNYRVTIKLLKVENGNEIPVMDSNGNEETRVIQGDGEAIFESLQQYENGTKIEYKVKEEKVEKLESINNETQEEKWVEIPLSQFKVTYQIKQE